MKNEFAIRDERTIAVENASYRLAYTVLAYGVLLSVIYRGFVLQEGSWDLMALVILSSGIAAFYQGRHKILDRRMLLPALILMLLSGLAAAIIAFLLS